ncbi:MAG: acetyl-CoA carboxylase carboxyltransferase subunit beta [Candidatus Marinimicrobia bacterium]|nr:acetyl-CoA carboxylase carboxyltransferase subunit beta [Candidatus Neomarinimicrobiota bacterium]
MTEWFRRKSEKIKTFDKREIAEGMWLKCPGCSEVVYRKALLEQNYVCVGCSHHFRITSGDYINLLVDDIQFEEFCTNIVSVDPLEFVGTKKYADQLVTAKEKTGSKDAVKTIVGNIGGVQTVLAIMDFSFIGGSMGSVVGEKIARAIDKARELKCPILIITASGGARMQEGAYSLMQMAKISAKLAQFSDEGGLYVTLLTDPTTGGTTASFAMLGDIILAETNALIGFAGARVIKQTIGEDLPEGFQRAEFLLEKGFVDNIVDRSNLKSTLIKIFTFFGFGNTP